MAPDSSTLAWKIPWTEEPGRLQSMGLLRVGHDWKTSLSFFTFMHWRRKWQPTPVFLPGESQGGGAWWAAVYGVAQSWTWLKQLSSSSNLMYTRVIPREKWVTQRGSLEFRLKSWILNREGGRRCQPLKFSSVQSLSCVWLFVTPWIVAHQASLSITNSRSSLRLMSIESVMPSSHLILCRPLLLLSPIPPSIRVFSNESTLRMRWPKYLG